jgi:phosphonate transport system substrate-binding protein
MTYCLPSLVRNITSLIMKTIQSSAIFKIVALFAVLSIAFSCSNNNSEKSLTTINVGVLPDQKKEILVQKYQALLEYLHEETGLAFKLVIPKNYSELVSLFEEKRVDLGFFGGVTFAISHQSSEAIPLVLRGKDLKFTSSFITRVENNSLKISDFKNKSIAFGSKLSTSGHTMPRFFLSQQNIEPETFFSNVKYSGKHDLTAIEVQEGRVDLGVANSVVIKEMFNDGRLKEGEVHVLWETPPYADYVWAVQNEMNKSIQIKIRDAFFALSKNNPKHKKILHNLCANHFLPADIKDFSAIIELTENHN